MVMPTLTSSTTRARRSSAGLRGVVLGLAAFALLAVVPTTASAAVDDWVHSWEVVRLVDYQQSQVTPPDGVFVYYLGDSIARESIISDASWTRALARRAADAGRVTVFAARGVAGHNQTFGMDEALVKGLPSTPGAQPRGIVLIGVGISRFIGPPASMAPAPLESPAPGEEPPLSPWVQHHYDDRAPLSLARKRELVPRWMERRWAGFRANRKKNVAAIQRVITLCRSKGLRPILIDLPLDLRVVGSGLNKPRTAIRSAVDGLASRNGIRYVRFNGSLDLPSSAFWDLHHLRASGYRRWQARLSDEIVKALPKAQ
jgi:hypothetical protein